MGAKNQITVEFESGFLKIVNVDGVNPHYERLSDITHVHSNYFDFTVLNNYQPGHVEFDESLEVYYRVHGIAEDNPLSMIDINNVTNQPTWTKDKAGLDKAVSDLILASGSGGGTVTLAQTDMSAIGATEEIVVPFYTVNQWSLQVEWNGLDANTATVDLLASNNGTDFEPIDDFTTIACDPIPDSSASVEKTGFPYNYLKILITKNTVTTGTIDYFINK